MHLNNIRGIQGPIRQGGRKHHCGTFAVAPTGAPAAGLQRSATTRNATCAQLSSRRGAAWSPALESWPQIGCSLHRSQPASASWVTSAVATAERGIIDTTLSRYRCHSRDGAVVDAIAETHDGKVTVRVTASYANAPHMAPRDLQLHWGMYRASGAKWHHPKEAVPPDSTLDAAEGAMRTVMSWVAPGSGAAAAAGGGSGLRGGYWTVRFEVPLKLAPLHLAFALYHPATGKYDIPFRAPHFSVPVGMSGGVPEPLGASVVASRAPPDGAAANGSGATDPRDVQCAVNFSVFSRHASSVQLCLVRVKAAQGGGRKALQAVSVLEVKLDPLNNRTGDVWHICVHGLKDLETLCWAWRADGEILWQNGNRFHPGFMLLDPHATRAVPVLLPDGAHKAAPRMAPNQPADVPVLLGSLAAFVQPPFDWQGFHTAVRGGQSRVRPLEEGVVVAVDVERFTQGDEAEKLVPPEHRGKYLGILDRLDQLKLVGATAVLLGPVALADRALAEGDRPAGAPGSRSPLSLLAPDPAFAVGGPLAAASELKEVVRGLHRAGIEVLLQVEFCVTAEGGDASTGRLQGLRGLDHAVYYRDGLEAPVLNCGHPVTRSLVVAALRHWAAEYRVEGFVFNNAENLTQDKFGSVLDAPPLAEEIAQDPVLRNLKLAAAVANPSLLPRSGERGFPHWGIWMQVNDRFRNDLLSYLAGGQRGLLSAVATRLTGSADLFEPRWDAGLPGGLAVGRRPAFGLNTVGPLGDVPLWEQLDPAGSDPVRAEALARSLLLAQFVSAGQPLAAASTLLDRPGVATLAAALSAVRRGYGPLLCPGSLAAAEREITWLTAAGAGEPDWQGVNPDPAANVMVACITSTSPDRAGHTLLVALNPQPEPITLSLPAPAPGACWRLLIDTGRPLPAGGSGGATRLGTILSGEQQWTYGLAPYGGLLLDAVPKQAAAAAATSGSVSRSQTPSGPGAAGGASAKTPPPGYGMSPAAAAAGGGQGGQGSGLRQMRVSPPSPRQWSGDSAGSSGEW